MSDYISHSKIKISSEKNFGIVFSIFFFVIGLWNFFYNDFVSYFSFFLSLILFIIAIFFNKIFYYPNLLWFKFGVLLGKLVSPVVMFLIFITTFLPIGFALRLIGKDLLRKKMVLNSNSYWENRQHDPHNMKNQF